MIVRNNIPIDEVNMDSNGRVISINSNNYTFTNVYPSAGMDASSRQAREKLFSDTLPNLLHNRRQAGAICGD